MSFGERFQACSRPVFGLNKPFQTPFRPSEPIIPHPHRQFDNGREICYTSIETNSH